MKKFFVFVVGVAVTIYSSKAAAQNVGVPFAVSQSLESEFKAVSNLRWEIVSNEIYLARFNYESKVSIAYIDHEGKILMTGRLIAKDQGSRLFQSSLEKFKSTNEVKYGVMTITHIFEVIQDEATKYFVNMGNNKVYIALTTDSNGRTLDVKKKVLNLKNAEATHLIVKK